MAKILVITPNTMLDHLVEAPFLRARVNRIAHFDAAAGGKGLNVGRVLVRHGHHVIACGFAGGSSGDDIRALITADGLDEAMTPTAARTRIGFSVSDPDGTTTTTIEGGFAVTTAECTELVETISERIAGCDLVIGCGSVPSHTCDSLWRRVLALCATANIPCWIDSYGNAMTEALTSGHPPALAKPNREEYQQDRAWLACPELHLSDGGGTLKVRHPKGRWRVTPPKVDERNPIGCGDCYLAGLAHARLSGMSLPDQFRYASAAGAANAARADVARIGPTDIRPLVDRVEVLVADEAETIL
jgi:tagatose 6-phosphate kinase